MVEQYKQMPNPSVLAPLLKHGKKPEAPVAGVLNNKQDLITFIKSVPSECQIKIGFITINKLGDYAKLTNLSTPIESAKMNYWSDLSWKLQEIVKYPVKASFISPHYDNSKKDFRIDKDTIELIELAPYEKPKNKDETLISIRNPPKYGYIAAALLLVAVSAFLLRRKAPRNESYEKNNSNDGEQKKRPVNVLESDVSA